MDQYLVVFKGYSKGKEVWDWIVIEGDPKHRQKAIYTMAVAVQQWFPMLSSTQVVNICKIGKSFTMWRLFMQNHFTRTVDVLVPTMALLDNGDKIFSQVLVENILKPETGGFLKIFWDKVEPTARAEFTRAGYRNFKVVMLGIQYL